LGADFVHSDVVALIVNRFTHGSVENGIKHSSICPHRMTGTHTLVYFLQSVVRGKMARPSRRRLYVAQENAD